MEKSIPSLPRPREPSVDKCWLKRYWLRLSKVPCAQQFHTDPRFASGRRPTQDGECAWGFGGLAAWLSTVVSTWLLAWCLGAILSSDLGTAGKRGGVYISFVVPCSLSFSLESVRLSLLRTPTNSCGRRCLVAKPGIGASLPFATTQPAHFIEMADYSTKEKPATLENGYDESDRGDKVSAVFQNTDDTDLPDPDEGKSPEERAKIVCGKANALG